MLFFSSISLKDKALFYENVANLLEGGVTLLMSLKGLRDRLSNTKLKEGIDHLLFFVEGGDAVNVAMRKLPDFFEEQEIAIVESGEQTGMIQEAFLAIANDLRSQDELRSKITSALTYPVIIMFFLALAVSVVMIYVVPQLMPIIGNLSGDLPLTTQALIMTSNFLKENILFLLVSLIGIGLIFLGYMRTGPGAYFLDKEKLVLPIVGPVYKNYLIVRTMSTFYLLNSSGVSIVKTLRLTGASSGNVLIKKLYTSIADDIAGGNKISKSMLEHDKANIFFTSDIIQMIESAEKTSTIGGITQKIAIQYRREVDFALGNMIKYIEPIALLMAGVFVLWFAIAIFGAIMQIVTIAGQ